MVASDNDRRLRRLGLFIFSVFDPEGVAFISPAQRAGATRRPPATPDPEGVEHWPVLKAWHPFRVRISLALPCPRVPPWAVELQPFRLREIDYGDPFPRGCEPLAGFNQPFRLGGDQSRVIPSWSRDLPLAAKHANHPPFSKLSPAGDSLPGCGIASARHRRTSR